MFLTALAGSYPHPEGVFSDFDPLSICISVYLGPPLSPTATRAERTSAYLKSLKTYLKSLKTYLKSLGLPKVHRPPYLKSTAVIH
ncbi:hypothetical protein Blolo01_20860 [Bifidobacterium longum subsp. longum]|nr:hypothetical protein MCC10007_0987 [Bifidobacterium longum subsp. longum]GLV01788.1 hypothetical protein Blolo01_20860 [Bifidobacterium longum subsp. longum]